MIAAGMVRTVAGQCRLLWDKIWLDPGEPLQGSMLAPSWLGTF